MQESEQCLSRRDARVGSSHAEGGRVVADARAFGRGTAISVDAVPGECTRHGPQERVSDLDARLARLAGQLESCQHLVQFHKPREVVLTCRPERNPDCTALGGGYAAAEPEARDVAEIFRIADPPVLDKCLEPVGMPE